MAKLVFIGDGESRAELEELARGASIEFARQKNHQDVLAALREAKGAVCPSVCWETFGLTSVESQGVGTPVAVSDLGGLLDTVVEGETGFVFKHGDADACAAAIRKVLSLSPEKYDSMAATARRRVEERYTEAVNFTQLRDVYAQVTDVFKDGGRGRVLLVHNYYGSSAPSGENKVFEAECEMLRKYGYEVDVWTRHSDEIRGTQNGARGTVRRIFGMVKGALCTLGNPFSAHALVRKCREFRPDVIHFHNTFPLVSPLCLKAAKRFAPVVMTLHNYRTVCAAGIPMRDGEVCTLCLDKMSVRDSLKYRCYRGGLAATVPLALNIWWYRKRWDKWVDRFIVLSEFQKRRMVECGWCEDKLVVKGNFTTVDDVPIVPAQSRRDEIVYVGRLSKEKGVFVLLDAWKKVAENIGGGGGVNVEFIGMQPRNVVVDMMRHAKCVILPSEWYETFGLTVIEAMSVGTPVIVSELGALPEIVR